MADATLEAVRDAALWFEAGTDGLGPLLDAIGDASLVLIGEASHGTHEQVQRLAADWFRQYVPRHSRRSGPVDMLDGVAPGEARE
jgi:erythromycin esterase-like protein